jgi:hypothetical protein
LDKGVRQFEAWTEVDMRPLDPTISSLNIFEIGDESHGRDLNRRGPLNERVERNAATPGFVDSTFRVM